MSKLWKVINIILKNNIILVPVIVIICVIVGTGSVYFLNKSDNPVEEVAEEIIKIETGKDIDLTPNSLENNKN